MLWEDYTCHSPRTCGSAERVRPSVWDEHIRHSPRSWGGQRCKEAPTWHRSVEWRAGTHSCKSLNCFCKQISPLGMLAAGGRAGRAAGGGEGRAAGGREGKAAGGGEQSCRRGRGQSWVWGWVPTTGWVPTRAPIKYFTCTQPHAAAHSFVVAAQSAGILALWMLSPTRSPETLQPEPFLAW